MGIGRRSLSTLWTARRESFGVAGFAPHRRLLTSGLVALPARRCCRGRGVHGLAVRLLGARRDGRGSASRRAGLRLIAADLDAYGTANAHGGAQAWPWTVRAVVRHKAIDRLLMLAV